MKTKSRQDTFIVMSELVLPNDTNTLGNLMGGRLMHWMDIAAAIASQKHCNCPVVTASVDNVSFAQPFTGKWTYTLNEITGKVYQASSLPTKQLQCQVELCNTITHGAYYLQLYNDGVLFDTRPV